MEVIKQIEIIIKWWINLKKGYQDVENLMYTQQKLTGYSWYLAEETAQIKKEYNLGYFTRKINVNKKKNAYIEMGKSATASESLAVENTAEDLSAEIHAESTAYRMDLLMRQVNQIINALTQRISYLKQELERSKKQV